MQGSTLAVARWPGATRNTCRATTFMKIISFSGPIGPPNIFQPTYILNLQHYPNKVKKYKYF